MKHPAEKALSKAKVLNTVKTHIKDKKGVKAELPYKFQKNTGAKNFK